MTGTLYIDDRPPHVMDDALSLGGDDRLRAGAARSPMYNQRRVVTLRSVRKDLL
jgi:hypothetical protein